MLFGRRLKGWRAFVKAWGSISDDILEIQNTSVIWTPSAVATINGQGVQDYLSQFAAVNAFDCLEPNAEWNQLMYSPALDIQGYPDVFGGFTTFYPDENLTFKFENGTELDPIPWLAIYSNDGPTGPLTTGGDFYNFFVLGLYPASFNVTLSSTASGSSPTTSTTSSSPPTMTAWANPAYPQDPDIVQTDLSMTGGGVLTGYLFNETMTGVLSIPSFEVFDNAIDSFSSTVGEFLRRSKAAGMKKIIIDVQQNAGGNAFLAFDTFKQFFPTVDPFGGSRLRAQPLVDVLGNTITNYYNTVQTSTYEYYALLSANEWVATDRLNAETGQNFTSWTQFYGPHADNNDYSTTTERYNLSSPVFDIAASGGILVHGYGARPATSPQPYASEDIIILTDALCSSACALFMEMMHHEAGVRTVVVGGQPRNGPMQAPSGSRGAAYYTSDDIDANINYAERINATTISLFPPRDPNILITRLGLNLRDQIRRGETTPLQFIYEAATCRIFYTPQTIYNYTNLWHYAARAIWTNPHLCVSCSAGYAASNATDTTGPAGASAAISANVSYDLSGVFRVSGGAQGFNAAVPGGIPDFAVPVSQIASAGKGAVKPSYRSNVPRQYRNLKEAYAGNCGPASPYCGGTHTGANNPQNTLPAIPLPG